MIQSFSDKETEKIWKGEFSRKFPPTIQSLARRKLRMIHNSQNLEDLRIPPSNHLELLAGDRKGQYSIRINIQWRICFSWHDGEIWEVEIADYH